jgi:NAD(P)-dependent dehydrogenase (short-subunit alcohol dehydrogenase family)
MFDLSGRTALVTGASGGIGGAIAAALHARGAALILTGTRGAALNAVAATLGGNTRSIAADLAEISEVARLASLVGPVDILVNNAGVSHREPTKVTPDAAWNNVIEVDLGAVFRLCRAILPGMAARQWGRVIAIGSILGETGAAQMGPYVAAKAGLVGLTKSLAAEYAIFGVTVNCVAPGYIRTPMMDMNSPEMLAQLLARIPVGHFGAPADVAAAVLYLASSEARFVTGATLHVNGGMSMS